MAGAWDIEGSAVEDLYEMAAIVEQAGFDFYARLIARAADRKVKNQLKSLRNEEAAHRAFFLDRLRARGCAPKGTVPSSLHALLDREFLKPMESLFASKGSDDDTTLGLCVALEQKSIELYTAMKYSAGEAQAAEIARIIAEEEAHKKKLELIRAR